jgi:predicted PurR-regulated permease PerM
VDPAHLVPRAHTRERYLDVTDRIIRTTWRYMLGNLAISVICATVYGVTAVILGLPYPLALALIAGFLDLIPRVGATIAGVTISVVALSVGLEALVAFAIVMLVYQQIENYVLQPTIIGRAARVSGLQRARQRAGGRSTVRLHRGGHRRAVRSGVPDSHRGAHGGQEGSHRGRRPG